MRTFEEINSTGTTVLFATHDHSLISKRDHRLIAIDEGRVVEAQQGAHALFRSQGFGVDFLSEDAARYHWDGKVLAHGISASARIRR